MEMNIYAQIPDEDISDLVESIKIISTNKHYSELKKVDFNNTQELIMAYIACQLHYICYEYKEKVRNA